MPDETPKRTAKSCGPDAAMLASSLAGVLRKVTVTTSPLTGESTKYAVKPLRGGCRSVSAALYARVRQLRNFWHTRPRVQRAPGIPCALYFNRGTTNLKSSGENKPRERLRMFPRHCERSDLSAVARRAKAEAIHLSACRAMDCFVASAPRNDG